MATWEPGPGVIELPDGRRVRARALNRPAIVGSAPDLGVYLLGHDPGPFDWEHRWIRCPDFRSPVDRHEAMATLRSAHQRSATERVEVGCGGGIGRTGLAIAVFATLSGVHPRDAVAWTRARHDPRAVETPWQRRWVRQIQVSAAQP